MPFVNRKDTDQLVHLNSLSESVFQHLLILVNSVFTVKQMAEDFIFI